MLGRDVAFSTMLSEWSFARLGARARAKDIGLLLLCLVKSFARREFLKPFDE